MVSKPKFACNKIKLCSKIKISISNKNPGTSRRPKIRGNQKKYIFFGSQAKTNILMNFMTHY